ncbi:aminotransferase class I/II-fold pyridoxal phosphate-dependent enzyme [Acuticoccus yangtzensis]|uniref:aminotransferase class I/II-fold pyridoxal phosphate-dependent enzyme n=1 Tax=Acuticoccus yangtzensis TaxID=1443441 RepID=UPI000AED6150|nr:aminotransferase class I/II-fold pyridoxal phosphate-dependent enzyme [Acuticoccus yangtzensis]
MPVPISPFDRLRSLIGDTPAGAPVIDLSVGVPKHAPPDFILPVLAASADGYRPYPAITGTPAFQAAIHDWLDRRYALDGWFRDVGAVLPLAGSREGLVLSVVTARDLLAKDNPVVLHANPYYQAYLGAAHMIGAEAVGVPTPPTGSPLPDFSAIPDATLDRAIAYYFGSPSNPAGLTASKADWHNLFDLAEKHDFFLFADECYSEIYREEAGPPAGALEAARERPEALKRLIVLNSLSKRSNLAGMRIGFVAGDREVMKAMTTMRNQIASQVPVPLQQAAIACYQDEAHVAENRRLYDAKFAAADAILGPVFGGPVTPPGGFCLWLPVADDIAFVKALWAEAGVRALPGSLLATGEGAANPGRGRIRLAVVSPYDEACEGFRRIAALMQREGAVRELAAG